MRHLPIFILVLFLSACERSATNPGAGNGAEPGNTTNSAADDAANRIEPAGLLADVSRIAADEFEGRGPGSDGDRAARAWLASRLAELGFQPLYGDSSWEQPVEIVGLTANAPENWTFKGTDGSEASFRYADEYVVMAGLQQERISVPEAELVFVGYGIQAPEENWDDYKGQDLSGKILLMLNDDPDWDPNLFGGERKLSYGRWDYKYASAARQGAAGALIIHTSESAGYPWQVVRASNIGEQFELTAGNEARTRFNGWLDWDSSMAVAALGGFDLEALIEAARSPDFEPRALGVTASIDFSVHVNRTETANVAGIYEGRDPRLKEEFVVLSAHHDHFGIGEPDESGDAIYNGALDNGVAIAQTLAVAGAISSMPERPRRSIVVLYPAVEEQGILGSKYFVRSGVIHPGRIAANINFELGNVWGRTRDVIIYGKGKSELDDLVARSAEEQGRSIRGEQDVKAGWFYRSDQIAFARAGVPATWFKSGVDFIGREAGWGEQQYADWIKYKYHTPGDEVEESWNLEGLAEDARLAFRVVYEVANTDQPPAWYPGDEFEALREASLNSLDEMEDD